MFQLLESLFNHVWTNGIFHKAINTINRVPSSTGKPGKSQIKVPCMEKSWNLKTTEKSWKNHGIL